MAETSTNKLKGVVMAKGMPLGSTEDGANWCLKALHPSEDLQVHGYPDGSCARSVYVAYTRQVTLAPAAPAGNWMCDLFLYPNPIDFGAVMFRDPGGSYGNIYNTCLESAVGTRLAALTAFGAFVEEYRCVHGSMTIHLNATATTDSGVAVATQYAWVPKVLTLEHNSAARIAATPIEIWPDAMKQYATLVQIPGLYTGDLRNGVYMPLQIDNFDWKSANDFRMHVNMGDSSAYTYPDTTLALLAAGVSNADVPYGLESTENDLVQTIYTLPSCGNNVGHVCMVNVNQTATLEVTYRLGFEFKVTPGTALAPMMNVAPAYDRAAMEAYRMIRRELASGYPESYNGLGTLLKPIWEIAKDVVPRIFPQAAPVMFAAEQFASKTAPVIKSVIQDIQRRRQQRKAARAQKAATVVTQPAVKGKLRIVRPPR